MKKTVLFLSIFVLSGSFAASARNEALTNGQKETPAGSKWAPAVQAKPLSENVKRGLAWLVKNQRPEGGFAQGEESANMGRSMDNLRDAPNVGDTCTAALAFLRSGSTPGAGEYADNLRRAADFVCGQVETSEEQSLWITATRNTRLQGKLGTYIDTFLAATFLSEIKDRMPDEKGNRRVSAALDKVMAKIERNQRPDGSFDDRGWANALAQGMASKGINKAAQSGAKVDEKVREKAEKHARDQYDRSSGKFSEKGSAGVQLYSNAASLGAMQDSVNTNEQVGQEMQLIAKEGKTEQERQQAGQTLKRFDEAKSDLKAAKAAVVGRLEDQQFISGFGSNGGEEFLSYLNIGESLVVEGGPEWEKWDKKMTENLNRIQNQDGSWTGHHCITGRTFCTAAAIMVLITDRTPVPIGADFKRR